MSLVRTLRTLASQRPTTPSRAVASPARVQRRRHGHVSVTWIDEHLSGTSTIVHLHGGSYLHGEDSAHWAWLEEVARRSGAAAAMVHYRMPPRHPYPAAVEDVLRALDAMGGQGVLRPERWVLSGDEAGGGLALAVAGTLAPAGGDVPALLLLASPWADLAAHHEADTDRGAAARLYAGAVPPENSRLSPLDGDLSGLPPVHLVTGSRDALVEDSRRLDRGLQEAGVEVEHVEIADAGDEVAVRGEGPASQAARRAQIAAIRQAVGLENIPSSAH